MYGRSLRPIGREKHFEVGIYFHELMHYYFQLIKAGYKVGDPHLVMAMETKMRGDIEELTTDFIGVLSQVHLMFRRYLDRRTEEIDSGIQVLEVEFEFKHAIDDSVGLHGIIDLLYRRRGKLKVRDHKTGENKSAHSPDSIEMDDQLLTYAVVVWQLFGEIPDIEISWVNSKVDYKTMPSKDQLFALHHKTLDSSYLEAVWTDILEYVYHMQTVKPLRFMNGYKCKGCQFRIPCQFSMKGLPIDNILAANFKEVPRDYDFRKFTEIARKRTKNSGENTPNQGSNDRTSGPGLTFNFS